MQECEQLRRRKREGEENQRVELRGSKERRGQEEEGKDDRMEGVKIVRHCVTVNDLEESSTCYDDHKKNKCDDDTVL